MLYSLYKNLLKKSSFNIVDACKDIVFVKTNPKDIIYLILFMIRMHLFLT